MAELYEDMKQEQEFNEKTGKNIPRVSVSLDTAMDELGM